MTANKTRTFTQFEIDVTNTIESNLKITTSDAQAMVEAIGKLLYEMFQFGETVVDAAEMIGKKSIYVL